MCADRHSDLRAKAEVLAATRLPTEDAAAIQDLPTALHQLRVCQIELELQAKELESTQQALRDSQQQFVDLYQHAPVGYLTLDVHGVIVGLNLSAATMLGGEHQDLIGRPLAPQLSETSRIDFLRQ